MEVRNIELNTAMIDKINTNQIRDMIEQSASKQTDPAKAPLDNQVDASLQVDYASLVEKAILIPPENARAVEEARQLLLSGQLDSPDNIRQAAENMLEFGI